MNVLNFIRSIKLHLQKLIYLDTPTGAPTKVFGMTFVKNVFLSLLLTTKKVDQASALQCVVAAVAAQPAFRYSRAARTE